MRIFNYIYNIILYIYMIIIFDTHGGLCNQFYDIVNGINFCLINNIQFTFRYSSFRNDNLTSWVQVSFEKIFEPTFGFPTAFLYLFNWFCNIISPKRIVYNTFDIRAFILIAARLVFIRPYLSTR